MNIEHNKTYHSSVLDTCHDILFDLHLAHIYKRILSKMNNLLFGTVHIILQYPNTA